MSYYLSKQLTIPNLLSGSHCSFGWKTKICPKLVFKVSSWEREMTQADLTYWLNDENQTSSLAGKRIGYVWSTNINCLLLSGSNGANKFDGIQKCVGRWAEEVISNIINYNWSLEKTIRFCAILITACFFKHDFWLKLLGNLVMIWVMFIFIWRRDKWQR